MAFNKVLTDQRKLWINNANSQEDEPDIIPQFDKDAEIIPPLVKDSDSEDEEDIQCVPCKPRPTLPSMKEIEEHNLTHSPYRSWCPACVLGQARNDPHKREAARESTIPIVSIDYG